MKRDSKIAIVWNYFKLQFKLINRKFKDAGLEPWMAYVLLFLVFIGTSFSLFSKLPYPNLGYAVIAISFLLKLSKKFRNDFLKQIFINYRQIRIAENIILSIPFVVFLVCKTYFLTALCLCLLSVLLAFYKIEKIYNFTLIAPFTKRLYEFQVGFRKLFYVYPVLYYLTYISTTVANPNLGVAALLGLFGVSALYYLKPEKEYFVWNYNVSPKVFLRYKITTAIVYTTILCLPLFVIFAILYPSEIFLLANFYVIGCIYLTTAILMKYSDSFSSEISIPQFVIYALGFSFPPFILFIAPYFYIKSIQELKRILHVEN